MTARLRAALAALILLAPAGVIAQDVLHLDIGDPARRDKQVPLVLDAIVDTRDGALLDPAGAAARLDDVRLLLVGESHTTLEIHRAQERIVRALLERGRTVLIGLEMFPVTEQPGVDLWNAGADVETFLDRSGWYEHWGYHFGYYEEIFRSARAGGATFHAVNAPRAAVTAVRTRGFEQLSEAERIGLPPSIDTDDADHLRLFKAYIGDGDDHGGMSEAQWQAMFAAQCTWDAAMGYNAVRALAASDDQDAIMVVLVGSGHVSYGLGIARQAARFFDGTIATMIPVEIYDVDGHPIDAVQGSFADFVWGVPAERDTHYPSLGATIRDREGNGAAVLFVTPESAAAAGGLRGGDTIVAIDGDPVADREAANRRLAAARWGDAMTLRVKREDDEIDVRVELRRRR